MAGRVLVRFLKAAQDQNLREQLVPLRAEIAFLRGTLMKAGERMPLACTYRASSTFLRTRSLSWFRDRLLPQDAGRCDQSERGRGTRQRRDTGPDGYNSRR